MKRNRNRSAKNSIQKYQTLNTEDIIDLTSEYGETIESGLEELDNADNSQAIKKRVPKTDKQNKSSKKAKGKINTKNGVKLTGKPNRKELKKEKEKTRLKCKSHKCPYFVAVVKAKRIWELMRHDDCPKEQKETLLNDLFKHSKPHLQTMVYSHDTICIIQWMLKLGTPEIRSQVINELIKYVPKMLYCKYACLSVKNMLKQGDEEQRKIIINSLKGKVYTYTLHTNSAKIIDLMYTTYATPEQQNAMMHELYGASSILCDSPNVLSLTDILNNSPNTKDIILAKTKDRIEKFVLKQKTSIQTTLVHNLIYEYIVYTGENECNELITLLKEFPIEIFYTSKSGCYLAMYIIWFGNSKENKSILKKVKATAATRDLATSDYGYLILFALFDSVDDIVLVKKIIVPEILENLEAITINENGRKFILALVAWRDLSYLSSQDIDQTTKGKSLKKCKNDEDARVKEFLNAISDGFLQHIQDYPKFWFSGPEMAMVLQGILQSCSGAKLKEAMTSVANFLINPKNKVKDRSGKVPIYEHSGVHMVLRLILRHDTILAKKNEPTFSEVLSSIITTDTLKSWIKCNNACYLLVLMMDSKVGITVENIKSLFSTTIMDLLKEQQFAGAEVLVTRLNSIVTNE